MQQSPVSDERLFEILTAPHTIRCDEYYMFELVEAPSRLGPLVGSHNRKPVFEYSDREGAWCVAESGIVPLFR